MQSIIAKSIVGSILVLVLASEAHAKCKGNACGDIKVTRENGCVIIQNDGERRVKFSQGIGSHSPTLWAGEKVRYLTLAGIVNGTNQCKRSIDDWEAKYVD